ncbi:MAG TPA: sigma-70 family RNA polymerase sigma factor [Pyrinomonadaceae bacterium]
MLNPLKIQLSHEDLFVERYDRLMSQALHLTEGDKQQAQDLLHDAFIHFTLIRPDLEKIANTEGYLFVTLRNLRLSQVRRAAYSTKLASLASYDSFEFGLRARDLRAQIQVHDELRAICEYATLRKETSKAGSVLILRFFHGYYPSETALILRTPRRVVDNWLGIARREARLYLENPNSLVFMAANSSESSDSKTEGQSSDDPFKDIHARIFSSAKGECFSSEQLAEFYIAENESPIDCPQLAHLVSCAICLDEVNRILRIPSLSERNPFDVSGRDERIKGGGGPGDSTGGGSLPVSGPGNTFTRRSRRDAKVTFEHRPEELRFSANGFVVGSLKVDSERSEQTISINLDEKISFVEAFSEQGVRLLLMNIEPPPLGAATQSLKVLLSDNRSLHLSLAFSDHWPTLQTVYYDPLLSDASLPLDDTAFEGVTARSFAQRDVQERQVAESEVEVPAPQTKPTGAFADGDSPRPRVSLSPRLLLLRLLQLITNSTLWLKPATATVIVAALLLGSLFFFRTRSTSVTPSAEVLLAQSIERERELVARPDTVIHRTINLEERLLSAPGAVATGSDSSSHGATRSGAVATGSASQLLTRHRIEVWQNAAQGITARRLYDDKGALIAGDWRRSDGVQTLYHHGSKPQLQQVPKDGGNTAAPSFDTVWQLSPFAKEFAGLIPIGTQSRIEETSTSYVITYGAVSGDRVGSDGAIYKGQADVAASPGPPVTVSLIRASLTLNRADLHPIEQALIIRQGDETREYHFIETAFETRLPSTVAPAVFEPEPALLDTATGRREDAATISASPLARVPASPVVATASLEVEVLRLLGEISADMGQEVSVKREADGALHVEAIVESAKRKAEIVAALASISDNPALRIRIETAAEAQARIQRERHRSQSTGDASEVTQEMPTANVIPMDAEVRRYFQSKGVSGRQLDDEISRLSNRLLNRSHQAMLHAFAIKNLVERFSQDDLRSLDPAGRAKWKLMIAAHASAFQREASAIRQELSPIFGSVASSTLVNEEVSIADDAALFRAASRLAQLASQMNESIQSDFTISKSGRSAVTQTPTFWSSVATAQSLAIAISKH